jgi:hypothetical protein
MDEESQTALARPGCAAEAAHESAEIISRRGIIVRTKYPSSGGDQAGE